MGPPRHELDAEARRYDAGRLLVGGTPVRLVRLTEAGARTLDGIVGGEGDGPGAAALTRRLERDGLIHPLPGPGEGEPEVTAIVPVLDGGERLSALVATLAAEGPTIVVDDGSRDGSGERAERAGASVIRHRTPRGPAAARNAGLAAARTELVAFLDADCEVRPGWRRGLATMLSDDADLAMVAPRVRSAPGASAISRFERRGSPLDLGPRGGLVGPGRRIAYLPAAALLARRADLLELRGFEEAMRFGEDVDLVWRLVGAGRRVRYVPGREVLHRPRPTLRGLVAQRAAYGGSAVELAARHRGAAAPLRVDRHGVAIWASAALLGPRAAAPALAVSTALIARRGTDPAARRAIAATVLRGRRHSTANLARVLVREWLPPALLCATVSRRARTALLCAYLCDTFPVWMASGPPTDPLTSNLLHSLDRLSYAAGLWSEAARRRDFSAVRPEPLPPVNGTADR